MGSSRWILRRSTVDAARLLDGVGDVLRGDRAEQAPVVAGLLADREHRLVEQLGAARAARLDGLLRGALLGRGAALGRVDGALRRRLGELARDQVVAQVALGDVDDGALLAERLDVLEQDRLGHRASAPRARGTPPPRPPRSGRSSRASLDVGQQRELARALDRRGDLVLVAAAGAADPARADLAALGDEPAQRRDVLVVDLLDLVLAERAGLAPAAAGAALLVAPPCGLGSACFGHVVESF